MAKYNLVKVPIMGQEYKVNTQASPDYIKKIAIFVDEKMSEIQKTGIEQDSQLRIAVLAAMNIADDLFHIKDNNKDIIKKVDLNANLLMKKIDKELNKV
tara:strand:+ start:273 stop:569 length:297 start_codon:yes stop_codon:yes gene_type:complete